MDIRDAFTDAVTRLGHLSTEQLRQVLMDQTAEEKHRGLAAIFLAKRRDVPVEERVRWLLQSWDYATREVKVHILEALGQSRSPAAIPFVRETLSDPDLQVASMGCLAELGDPSILPLCEQFIRSATEREFYNAISALDDLGTPEALSLVEKVLRSGRTKEARLFAAECLASHGISTGEALLEGELFRLQDLLARSGEDASEAKIALRRNYVRIALSLADLNNQHALLALKQLLNTQSSTDAAVQYLKGLTLGMLKLTSTTPFDDWKAAMERWIDEKLA